MTATTTALETLASYVPHLVRRYHASHPEPLTAPIAERFPAAVLLADISGFTALTERLTQRGPEGVEDLSALLNAYFGQLISVVLNNQGDIIEFTGDGVIAVWTTSTGDDLTTAGLRAAQCGLEIQEALAFYALAEHLNLSLRVAVGAGEILVATIGGILGRWELLVAGDPLAQVSAIEHAARPGDVVLSAEAWELVQAHCRGQPLATSGARLEAVLVVPPRLFLSPIILTPRVADALRAYIPGSVLTRLDAGLSDWLAELRCVTVLFVCVEEVNYQAPDVLEQLQTIMQTLQIALYRYEGTVNQFVVDDKGTVFVAALGLPPLTHEDDAIRGGQAALAMYEQLHRLGRISSMGISTGWVFCGARGSARRRDYAMIGDVMNLAARLMQVACDLPHGPVPRILCDATTYEAANERLAFEELPAVRVKGKAAPVPVYRPLGNEVPTVRRHTSLIGREAERAVLSRHLQQVQQGEKAGVILIEGEMGMGKSRLISDAIEQAEARGIQTMVGLGDAVEHSTPYHAWRPIFTRLFNLDALPNDLAVRRRHVLERMWVDPQLARTAPLINAVLPLDIPDNEITAHMVGQVRAENTRRLLIRLMHVVSTLSPTLLVLDEAHWLDSASWALVLAATNCPHPMLIVIATRPMSEPLPVEYSQMRQLPDAHYLILDRLSTEEALQLTAQRLGVQSLPDEVATLILEKTQGNPFFAEELAYALRDAGLIVISDGVCRIAPDAGDLQDMSFPTSVHGVIISRIDRLMPAHQLTLKVASVIGHIFAWRPLHAVYPIEPDRPRLPDYLHALEHLNMTALAAPEPDLTYIFKHIIIHEVVYNLLLFSQRRELHRAVAEWYEREHNDDLAPYYPLLAHHWSKAEVTRKAIDYLEKAGEQALRSYANREAVGFFRQLLALTNGQGARRPGARGASSSPATNHDLATTIANPVLRQARWERQLGEAYLGLGQLAESRKHLERAVALLQRPVPVTRSRLTIRALTQVIRQTLHRAWLSRFESHTPAASEVMLETARAYELLMTIYFFANETLASIYTSLLTLNLAERAGHPTELARAYGNMTIATGSLALHGLAEAYSQRALETAKQVEGMATCAYVMNIVGLYRVGIGHWQEARVVLEEAVDIYEQLGDHRGWGASWTLLAQVAYYEGDFVRSNEMFVELYNTARRNGDVLQQAWAQGGQGQNLLRLGRAADACRFLEQANAALAQNEEVPSQISNDGLLALGYLRQRQLDRAQQAAQAAADLLQTIPVPTAYYLIEGYAGYAETCLAVWEASSGLPPAQRAPLVERARQACAALAAFARIFPIGQPRMHLWQGLSTWLLGKPAQAHRIWHEGLKVAERLAMPYEQGLLHYELGRHLTGPARREHLQQAYELFTRLNATGEAQRVALLMEKG